MQRELKRCFFTAAASTDLFLTPGWANTPPPRFRRDGSGDVELATRGSGDADHEYGEDARQQDESAEVFPGVRC
jgi:hypothetical protein